jgi:integral membrane sensor domain MASE1
VFFLASEGITLFWAAAGISSGLLIGFGSRRRWAVVAGIFLGAFAIPLFILGRGIWLATIFALCDTAEPLIIAALIARYFGADFALDRLRRVFRGGDEIAVSVQDSGPGIDQRQLENVFNVFVTTKAP